MTINPETITAAIPVTVPSYDPECPRHRSALTREREGIRLAAITLANLSVYDLGTTKERQLRERISKCRRSIDNLRSYPCARCYNGD